MYQGVDFAPRKKDKSPPAYHWLLSCRPIPNSQVELKIVEPIFRLFVNGIAPGQGEVGVSDFLWFLYGFKTNYGQIYGPW